MRKSFFLWVILPLVTAAFTSSCNDDDVIAQQGSDSGISFRLQSNLPVTRTTGTTTDYVNAFVVNASDDREKDKPGVYPDAVIFDAQTVYRLEGEANHFDYNPKKYYPNESEKAFYTAYSPVSKNIGAGFKGSTENKIFYTVLPPDGVSGNTRQEDLLVAYTEVTGAVQPTGATPVDRLEFNDAVRLNFKHALSRVYVKASNKNVEPVTITDISLHNLYDEGVLDVDAATWNDGGVVDINEGYKASLENEADYKVLWNFDNKQRNRSYKYVLPASGIRVAANTPNNYQMVVSREQGMMILPQVTLNTENAGSVEDGDFYLEVTYKLSNIENTVKAAFSNYHNIADLGLVFEFGKQYALAIEFDGVAVRFDIEVEDWNEPIVEPLAETVVVFASNKPANASAEVIENEDDGSDNPVENVYPVNTDFIDGMPMPDLTGIKIPALTGWEFQGYFDAPEGGKMYYKEGTGGDEGKLVVAAGVTNWDKAGPNQTLYAQWKATKGDIIIEKNENTTLYPGISGVWLSTSTIGWRYDERLSDVSAEKFTSKGYVFDGIWTTANEDGKQIYDAEGRNIAQQRYILDDDGDGDTDGKYNGDKLYIHWKAKTFTVIIDLNGGRYQKSESPFPTFTQTYGQVANFTVDNILFDTNVEDKVFKGFASTLENANGGTADVCVWDEDDATWQATYGNADGWTATDSPTTIWAVWGDEE